MAATVGEQDLTKSVTFCQTGLTVHAVTGQVEALPAEGFQNKIRVISSVIGYVIPFQPIFFTSCGFNENLVFRFLSDRSYGTCCHRAGCSTGC